MPIYDVENRFSYYKTYSDNILVGPPKPEMGDTSWLRAVSGSAVSGSEEYKAATFLSNYLFELNNQFFRSGEVRYLRLASATQKIEDSIAPSPLEIYTTGAYASGVLGAPNGSFTDELSDGVTILFAQDRNVITGSSGVYNSKRINNTEWFDSYPYEKKYTYVKRGISSVAPLGTFCGIYPKGQDAATEQLRWFETANKNLGKNLPYVVYFTSVANNGTGTKTYNEYCERTKNGAVFSQVAFTSDNLSLTAKTVFGINLRTIENPNSLNVTGSVISFCSGVYIEGWKYGLYNGIPTNFSCIFRQNHYGQPRDMLEGRPYTKTYNNPLIGGPLDEGGGINFISGSALSGESDNWLTASIYQAKNVAAAYVVNPYGSGIFDKQYRASQPWFDNDPRVGT
jgi:hypothetical protein